MRRVVVWLALCAALGAAVFAFTPMTFLTAEDENGQIVLMRPVHVGDRYTIRFIHSVARRPVDEIYEIARDCSILRETAYDMMGAGLPHSPEPGQTFTTENGRYHIRGYDLHIPALTYRINKVVADHTLLLGGHEYPLRLWISAPGKPLTFRVQRIAVYKLARYRDALSAKR